MRNNLNFANKIEPEFYVVPDESVLDECFREYESVQLSAQRGC